MKKIIGLMTSLSSVFLISSSMVSCGASQKALNENKENENNFLSDIDKSLFEEKLSIEGINGSIFDTENNGSDVLQLIKEEIREIDKTVKNIDLIDAKEKSNFLEQGNNYFTVCFESNNTKYEFPVLVKNVKDAKELDAKEVETFVNEVLDNSELLTVGYEDEDLDTDQVTRWKNVITKKLERRLNDVIVNVNTANTSKQFETKVTVEVDNLPFGIKKKTKEKMYTSPMFKSEINIRPRTGLWNPSYEEAVATLRNNSHNGDLFTTHHKKKEALFLFINIIKNRFKIGGLRAPVIKYDNKEMLEHLTEGTNKINYKIFQSEQATSGENLVFTLTQVRKFVWEKKDSKLKRVEQFLTSGELDAGELHEGWGYQIAASLAKKQIKKFDSNVNIFIDKSLQEEKLKAGNNSVELIVASENKSFYVNALFRNVKPISKIAVIKQIYGKPVELNWRADGAEPNSGSYEKIVSLYQANINSHFSSYNVKILLKNNSDKLKKVKPGANVIEVIYEQNGKKENASIQPYAVKYSATSQPNLNPHQDTLVLPVKIAQYVNQGIDVKQLGDHISLENNVYEAFDAVRKFLKKHDDTAWLSTVSTNTDLNKKLQQGDNKIEMLFMKDGQKLKFSVTLKNVADRSPEYAVLEKYRNPQDKKLWDVFNFIGSPDVPCNMAGRTLGEIPLMLQKVIEQKYKISGVKIYPYEAISVLTQKIMAEKRFPFKVFIQDLSTNRYIIVTLSVYVV